MIMVVIINELAKERVASSIFLYYSNVCCMIKFLIHTLGQQVMET